MISLLLSAAFFVATQFFFTLCFIGALIGVLLLVMYLLCVNENYLVRVLKWIAIDLVISGE